MKYSVLVPVFNTERYLRQCIESVLGQTCDDFELLLTNDGSTDNSATICEEYARKDSRIIFYNKGNEGLLLTRRHALKRAQGEYILFLDSDDYWEKNLLSTVDSVLKETPVDIVLYRFSCVDDNGNFLERKTGVFDDMTYFDSKNKDILLGTFLRSSQLNTMWTKCVKREIIDIEEDYSKFKDKKGEDCLQSIALMLNAETFCYLDRPLVNYRLSINGRGRNYKSKYALDTLTMHQHVYIKLIEAKSNIRILLYEYEGFCRDICESILPSLPSSCTYKQFKEIMSEISGNRLYDNSILNYHNLVLSKKEKVIVGLLKRGYYYIIYYLYRIYRKVKI